MSGKCLQLFQSYLYNRRQVTVVDSVKSDVKYVTSGVPQGSRLGPLLFILYINDIEKDLESEILIFADDTTLLTFGVNSTETSTILNRDLSKISHWAQTWKVKFGADKSRTVVFTNKLPQISPPIILDSDPIKQVDTHKHLGIILTYNLDWSPQVHAVIMKANKKLAVLRRIFYLQRKTLEMLYKVTVRSVIDFALPVYYHSLKLSDKNKLEQIQYKGAKLASGALHGTSMIKLNS